MIEILTRFDLPQFTSIYLDLPRFTKLQDLIFLAIDLKKKESHIVCDSLKRVSDDPMKDQSINLLK